MYQSLYEVKTAMDGLTEPSSPQARLALLLTHLTEEHERLRVVKAAAYRARSRRQACDTLEPSRSRSLTWLGAGRAGKPPVVTGVGNMGAPKGN